MWIYGKNRYTYINLCSQMVIKLDKYIILVFSITNHSRCYVLLCRWQFEDFPSQFYKVFFFQIFLVAKLLNKFGLYAILIEQTTRHKQFIYAWRKVCMVKVPCNKFLADVSRLKSYYSLIIWNSSAKRCNICLNVFTGHF